MRLKSILHSGLALIVLCTLSACQGGRDSAPVAQDAVPAGPQSQAPVTDVPVAVSTQDGVVTLSSSAGQVLIHQAPLGLAFKTPDGETVLSSTPQSELPFSVRALNPQRIPVGLDSPDLPPLYAPFSFLVGSSVNLQFPVTYWVGNMLASANVGIEYRLEDVQSVETLANGVRLQVSTSDPTGRMAQLSVIGDTPGTFKVSLALEPVNQDVPLITAAFSSPTDEAFHGFGGRRNAIDQRGQDFLNWAEEFHQTPQAGAGFPGNPAFELNYQFPVGPQGAYYVQSLFISSEDYGFLLERDELSHWRMASDRDDAWMVEVAGSNLDFVVAPGKSAKAIASLTDITGRHRIPPAWALGPMLSEAVQFTETTEQYNVKVQESLQMMRDLELPISAFIFEGWSGLKDIDTYQQVVDDLTALGIKPMTYYRAFLGMTDDALERPDAFEQALENGYVATNAAGLPYLFGSPLNNGLATLIDFTNPDAVRWWKDRIKQGLAEGSYGFMQDFGEQTFVDMSFADGSSGIEMHNRYARLYHQATREALDEYATEHPDSEVEPFFFVRNGYTGRQGSAAYESASWSGDNSADWSEASGLPAVIPDMLNRVIGGAYGFVTEIGGYIDVTGRPSKELLIRWAQQASLMPVHRLHGGPVNGTHMPWRYDQETVDEYVRTARRHIAAQPLILSLWQEALNTGMPITRPLWLAFPDDPQAAQQDQQFMLGPDILVAPVVTEGATSREVYFPAGCWRHPEEGSEFLGPQSATVDAPLDFLPYYFRCGSQPFTPPES